ncbi:MAG: tetratricopeptide repeat protein [Bacteroidales bacterium]|nr:tetratricopeptide repeat protein [Bacteroidales bacterium]
MRKALFILLLFIIQVHVNSQQGTLDSLNKILETTTQDTVKINTLIAISSNYYRTSPSDAIRHGEEAKELAQKVGFKIGEGYAYKSIGMGQYFQGNYADALANWQLALEVFQSVNFMPGIANMVGNIGAIYFSQGDDSKAIEYYLKSLKIGEEIGDTLRIATALVNIGAVYFNKKATYNMAMRYYKQALPISEALGDYDAIGTVTVNMGEIYRERNNYDSSLYYFNWALMVYQKTNTGNISYALSGLGKTYAKMGDYSNAVNYQKQAIEIAEENNSRLELTQSLIGLGNTYNQFGLYTTAISTYSRALEIAKEINAGYQIKESYEGLSESYAKIKDFNKAYQYQFLLTQIKDTLYNAELDNQMEELTLTSEIEIKQGQIVLLTKEKALQESDLRRQKTIRNAASITGILLLLLAIGLFNRIKYVRKTKKIIEDEKALSEKLLLNILPLETAEELKEKGSATPKHYDKVSVLFTDFKGFTKIAEKLTPQELVEELNQCFLEFDRIIDKHNLEKIKTIGDAYMCTGGIPAANDTNPVDIVKAGLEIKEYMEKLKKERESRGEDYWELRIGIHTGPVIAGVVGKNKFAYDIWGDAVNTASRMESSGIPGKVNISGTTYEYIKDRFNCSYRGKILAKNKGEIDMYIVDGFIGNLIQPQPAEAQVNV